MHDRAHLNYSIPCFFSLLACYWTYYSPPNALYSSLSSGLCMCCFLYLQFSFISWLISSPFRWHIFGEGFLWLDPFSTCANIACFSLSCISPIQYLRHTYTKNIHCLSEIKLNWKLILCLATLTCTHIICYITIVILFICFSRVSFHKL